MNAISRRILRRLAALVGTVAVASGPSLADAAPGATTLYNADFSAVRYGGVPDGWRDMIQHPPSRNWAVDANGYLRPLLKLYTGLIAYDGFLANNQPADALGDVRLTAEFKKTVDESVAFGVATRIVDRDNFYAARFSGAGRLELLKVKAGRAEPLAQVTPIGGVPPRPAGLVTLGRYREGERWTLSLESAGARLTSVVRDANGREQARLSVLDGEFKQGRAGLHATTFAAAASFRVDALEPAEATLSAGQVSQGNAARGPETPVHRMVRPEWKSDEMNTRPEAVAARYDVVVAGAGTGGWAAAIQSARMGARVLLLEETDWIGGQMCAAAVTTMDEGGLWQKFPARERGIYREFHESMVLYYQSLDKDPFVAYYAFPEQLEGGYEPKAARGVLYGFIKDVREGGGVLDVCVRARVRSVLKRGDTVTGAKVEFVTGTGTVERDIGSDVLIDATEYGDVIPLTGARYRVGNTTSDNPDLTALVQDHTWTAVLREYPDGVPVELQITSPPPGYEKGSGRRYRNYRNEGMMIWGAAGKGIKGPRHWRVYFAWRGMADADSPLTGIPSGQRHTQCGFNGGNDYPVTAATIEAPAQRLRDEREGIYKTLGALYYFQRELGVNWSLAADEGYATPYNRAKMKALGLRPDLEALAVHLPQQPYVRECRRIIGVRTLTAGDLTRFEAAKHFPTSVAMGDYFMDLDHGKTAHAIESDLDSGGELPRGGGPFQVPFEVFIPEKVDGFLPAEKNISQSRLANGATRLQPITMMTGQAAGAIAALAARQHVPPRKVNPIAVQCALLDAGSTLVQRWYADVPWGTSIWRATQLLSLHGILDRPGPLEQKEGPLGANSRWGVEEPLAAPERDAALARFRSLTGRELPAVAEVGSMTRGRFAVALAAELGRGTVARR